MDISTVLSSSEDLQRSPESASAYNTLTSQDFFKLIMTDLLTQDPLQPKDNEQLLEQIALIRNIEMNNEVTTTMRALVDQQRSGAGTTLIGQYVEADMPDGRIGGVVVGLRFSEDGVPRLVLDSGREVPLSALRTVTSLAHFADQLVGELITAEVTRDGETEQVEGVVTEVKAVSGHIMLELDNGQQVSLSSVRDQRSLSLDSTSG